MQHRQFERLLLCVKSFHLEVDPHSFQVSQGLTRLNNHERRIGVFLEIGEGAVLSYYHDYCFCVSHSGRPEACHVHLAILARRAEGSYPRLFVEIINQFFPHGISPVESL